VALGELQAPGLEPDCEGCDGSGRRDPALPSCALRIPARWHVLERCDACARFPSDEAAARSLHGDRYRIVTCADDGAHVIVPDAPARRGWRAFFIILATRLAAVARLGAQRRARRGSPASTP
jgi:hypothetical protein